MSGRIAKLKDSGALVVIVMGSALGFLHWGWGRLQDNPVFVKEHERKPHPFIIWGKEWWAKVQKGS